jgi:hypothetical protein
MGIAVMVLGKSGAGKSTSLRNFTKEEVGVLNVAGKPLPFKGTLKTMNHPTYAQASKILKANNLRAYVLDDSTYLIQFENFARAKEVGYGKFTDMAVNFERLLEVAIHTNDDTVVYFLHHPDVAEDGSVTPKTIGKMLNEKLCVEGLFPIVLEAKNNDGRYVFITNNDGSGIAKTPLGMFAEREIENDLKAVDSIIRNYWGLAPLVDTQKEEGAKDGN